MDANNLKGVGIELQFPDVAGLGTFTGQLLGQTSTAPKKPQSTAKLTFDVNEARELLRKDPELRKMFNQVVPSLMDANEFWASRKHQLRNDSGLTPGEVLSVQSYSSSIEVVSKRRAKYQTVTAEVMNEIFRKRPNVRRAYYKFVPHKYSQNEFFTKLIVEDQYKRGEIDEKQVATMTTGRMDKEVSSFIEDQEKETREHNTKLLLENADPMFDLRETSGEAFRGPISTREGYGLLDRSKRVVESVDNEEAVGGETSSSRRNKKGGEITMKSKHNKSTTAYLLNQFNQEGSRLLGHSGGVNKGGKGDAQETNESGEVVHPDLTSHAYNEGIEMVPLNITENTRKPKEGAKQEEKESNGRAAKRVKLEAGAVPQEGKIAWKFNPENAFSATLRPTYTRNRAISKPTNETVLKGHFQRCNEYLRFFWSLVQSKNNNEKLNKVVQRIREEIQFLESFATLTPQSKDAMKKRLVHAIDKHKKYSEKKAPRRKAVQSTNTPMSRKRSRED